MSDAQPARTGGRMALFNANRFWVEIDKVLEAYFTECSGLDAKVDTIAYKEGGFNSYVHLLPGRTSHSNLVLKRGMSKSLDFWEWFKKTREGQVECRDISIILYTSSEGSSFSRRWEVTGAYPVKWSTNSLIAKSNEFSIESLELAYQSFEIVR